MLYVQGFRGKAPGEAPNDYKSIPWGLRPQTPAGDRDGPQTPTILFHDEKNYTRKITSPPLLLLVHGWGLGPGLWQPVIRALPGWPCLALDLGFFGPAHIQIPPERPFLAVGHSLGFLWILQHLDQIVWHKQCLGLLSISGFSRFCRSPDFPNGTDLRIVLRMKQRFPEKAKEVLTEFRQRSGWQGNPGRSSMDHSTLKQGLEWLQQWDGRAALQKWHGPLYALAAKDDLIVPTTLTTSCFSTDILHWQQDGGHLLPLTRHEACAELIKKLGKLAT